MKQDGEPAPDISVRADSNKAGQPTDSAGTQLSIAGDQPRTWHVLSVEEVVRAHQADPTSGLSNADVARRRNQFGPNVLTEAKGRSILSILLDQFKSLIVALLIAATVVAFALGENVEAVAVLVVIVLNGAVGFFTEWKAEQALTALQQQAVPVAHVLRESNEHQIPAAKLVPGDVVIVAARSHVLTDGRPPCHPW